MFCTSLWVKNDYKKQNPGKTAREIQKICFRIKLYSVLLPERLSAPRAGALHLRYPLMDFSGVSSAHSPFFLRVLLLRRHSPFLHASNDIFVLLRVLYHSANMKSSPFCKKNNFSCTFAFRRIFPSGFAYRTDRKNGKTALSGVVFNLLTRTALQTTACVI